jgi:pimeloyl-ACP methyl ester carboxylesterase
VTNHTRLYALSVAFAITACDGTSVHTIRVFENRAAHSGREIGLHVVVLHARRPPVAPDPVVWLTGGPGLAATEDVRDLARRFATLHEHHDIVFVDQRGTGQSAPLDCPFDDFNTMFPTGRVRACRQTLSARADLTQYTTAIAMDDLADVLTALGYAQADLIGASYGTRAALVFLRRHPDRVRRVVVDGVSPPDQPVFVFTPRAIARELAAIDSAHVVDSAMTRLPVTVTRWNWWHFRRESVTITRHGFAELMFFLMYAPSRGRRAVRLLRQALAGDWAPFTRMALAERHWRQAGRSRGMTLSVLCTEDAPRLARVDTTRLASEDPLGLPIVSDLLAACAEWPRGGAVDTTRVSGSAPVLFISGGLDPATPPELADTAALGLPNSVKYVDPTAGHAMFYDTQVSRLTSFIL